MKQTITLVFCAWFGIGFQTIFGQWMEVNTITPTFYNSALAWDGKVYFAGGIPTFSVANNLMQIMDLETNSLLPYKTLSVGRGGMMAVAHKGKLYFAGGFKWVNDPNIYQIFSNIDIYDVAAGTFTTMHLSVPRSFGTAVVLGDNIMFAGGYTWNGSTLVNSDVVEILNTNDTTWTMEHLSQARGDLGGAVIGDKAYFCGGALDLFTGLASNRVDTYDAVNGWQTDTISVARVAPSVVAAGKYLLVAGGNSNIQDKYDVVDIFDTDENIWSTATLSEPRCYMAAAVIGKKAYFTGGGNCNAATFFLDKSTSTVDVFDAQTQQWGTGHLNKRRIAHACAAWGDKIAVGAGWVPEQNGFTGSVEVLTDISVAVQNRMKEDLSISLFPSPTNSTTTITFELPEQSTITLGIFDALGNKVKTIPSRVFPPGNHQLEIDLSGCANGVYICQLESNGQVRTMKLLVLK